MNNMTGFGSSIFGNSIHGYGVVSTIPAPSFPLEHRINDSSKTLGQTRFINPETKDYYYDSNGIAVGGSIIQQQVYMLIVTNLGSAVDPTIGISVKDIDVLQDNNVSIIADKIQTALYPLTNNNQIQIDNIDVVLNSNQTGYVSTINWLDLTTNLTYETIYNKLGTS